MEKVWHRILVRAGVIVGYRHTCRRCVARKQPATHELPNAEQRRCPTCNMRMWPSAIPRPMRFHDVRHTTATLLLKARVPIQHVQRILRHANIRTTVDTYGHLANEDLRAPLELLPAPTERALPSPIRPRHVPNMCQAARNPRKARARGRLEVRDRRAHFLGAEHRVRTGDLRLGKATLYQLS